MKLGVNVTAVGSPPVIYMLLISNLLIYCQCGGRGNFWDGNDIASERGLWNVVWW